MNIYEKKALKKAQLDLEKDLDATEIASYLFQENMIVDEVYEAINELNEIRRHKCRRLLNSVTSPDSKCTFAGFIRALSFKSSYTFLADKLQQILLDLQTAGAVEDENINHVIEASCSGDNASTIMYEPVRKINVFTKRRKVMATLAHKLKRLSHDGDYANFRKVVEAIDNKFNRNRLSGFVKIEERMELADMRFTALEAEASSRRVQNVQDVSDADVFRSMEAVIPFTSNPRVSSMTYLARYGSAVAMREGIDDGLAYIDYAKEHSEYVRPCKDTGMVYYIEVNLLSQKYEKEPSETLKATLLKTTEKGIAQFNEENDEVRKDYQRMLMLKMVFCHLGVGLFGKHIEEAKTTTSDIESAKKVIDFIETADMWDGMEKRRKMLFYVAKAEYYKKQGNFDLAIVHAKEAEKLAKCNNWNAELPNICNLVSELNRIKEGTGNVNRGLTAEEIIADFLGDLDLDVGDEQFRPNVKRDKTEAYSKPLCNYMRPTNSDNNMPNESQLILESQNELRMELLKVVADHDDSAEEHFEQSIIFSQPQSHRLETLKEFA